MTRTATKVRVLIVDDRALVLEGIREILGEDLSIEVVGAAATAAEALDMARSTSPDVIFLDANLATDTDFELITDIQHIDPSAECLVLAHSDDAETFHRALNGGAHGYLLDDASRDDIRTAVQRVAAGRSHIDPAVSRHLLDAPQRTHNHDDSVPSARAIEVLRLAASGLTNDAIARHLNLKTETVKTHMSRAFERLGAKDRASAVAICMRRGLF